MFTEETWQEKVKTRLGQFKRWLQKGDAPYIVYGTVAGLSLWPLAEVALKTPANQSIPVSLLLALGSVASGVGGNLIAEQLQRWSDGTEEVTEESVIQWVRDNVDTSADLRQALDDILDKFEAISQVQAGLSVADRAWLVQTLQQEMVQLGNLSRFEAELGNGSAFASGEGATAIAAQGVMAREIKAPVVTGSYNTVQTTVVHHYGEWHAPLPEDLAETRQAYDQYLVNELKDHTIRGFAPQVGGRVLSLPLAEIFLPLQAIEGRPALSEYAEQDLRRQMEVELDWHRSWQEMEKRLAQLQVRQAVQRPLSLADLLENRRAVLLGHPGSGKTTITRYVTYALAAHDWRHVNLEVRGLTPVLVRIANFATVLEQDRRMHIIDYVEKVLTPDPRFGRFLRHMITEGLCVIILDGLDEVEVTLRREVTERIRSLVAGYGQNRFLITSRIIGYEQSPLTSDFTHATLQDLSPDDQAQFIRLWYEAIKSATTTGRQILQGGDNLIKALRDKPQISRLAANPLLLTIMVLMHWRGVKLPSRRVQVYESATDTLIEYWRTQPGIESLDALEIKAILAPIAHYILSSNVSGVIARQDLLPRFYQGIQKQRGCSAQEARRIGKDMLQSLGEQSGIFLERGQDEDGNPVYGFLHQTFGEYLAALHMAEEMQAGNFDLSRYIHRSIWHESLLLMAGHLAIYSTPQANTLITQILEFPALYEDALRRNLLLAVDCLADDIRVKPSLRNHILRQLAELLFHETPQLRDECVTRYQRLAITSHKPAAAATLYEMYPLTDVEAVAGLKPEVRLAIAAALVYLGELESVRPILWPLTEGDVKLYETRQKARRLRIEYWPGEAAEYLLQLQGTKDEYFYVSVGDDLSSCDVGPVSAQLLNQILPSSDLKGLLYSLRTRTSEKSVNSELESIETLVQQPFHLSSLLPFLNEDKPPRLQQMAATRLLREEAYRDIAINSLQRLVGHEPEEAGAAAKRLLKSKIEVTADWNLLKEVAFLVHDASAPQAIDTLLQAGFTNLALPAALHLLANYRPESLIIDHTWKVAQSLFKHDRVGLGYATMRWLAARPGYTKRFDACEVLLDAGHIVEAVPLLSFIAHAHHGEDCQRASQQLLLLKEVQIIAPLLLAMSRGHDPALRYYAHMALALLERPLTENELQTRQALKVSVLQNQLRTYQDAVVAFCNTGLKALETLNPDDELSRLAVLLAKASLYQLQRRHALEDNGQTFIADRSLSRMWYELLTSSMPVIQTQGAAMAPQLEQPLVQIHLLSTWQNKRYDASAPLRVALLHGCSRLRGKSQVLQGLIEALLDVDSSVRSTAVYALGRVGDESVIPHLLTALADEDRGVRGNAAKALGRIGDESVTPHLLTALADEDGGVRGNAAEALGQIGDESVIPHLLTALADEDSSVRSSAAGALGQVGDETVIPHLLTALADEHNWVCRNAAEALGQVGDETVIPHLLTALADEDSWVRRGAAYALGRVGDESVTPHLLAALADEDGWVRGNTAEALGRIEDESVIPHLLTALADEDNWVCRNAAEALGQVGDESAVSHLLAALADEDGGVRGNAAEALGQIGDESVIPHLLAALSDAGNWVRGNAAEALGQVGDETVIPHLLTALADEDSWVRSGAANALGRIGDESVIPHLLTALADAGSGVRRNAAEALGRIGDESVTPHLLTALADEDDYVRGSAAKALGQIGDESVIPHLLTALADKYHFVRRDAAYALGEIGDESVIPHLLSALADKYHFVRRDAAYALGRMGDESVIPHLLTALGDVDSWVRSRAMYALGRLAVHEALRHLTNIKPADIYEAAWVCIATIHLAPNQALRLLQDYRRMFPRASRFIRLQGQVLWEMKDMPSCLSCLQNAVALKEQSENLLALGHYFFEQDDIKTAQQYISQATKKAPHDAVALLSQALLFWRLDQGDKARQALQQAQRWDRHVINKRDLQFDEFWRGKALATLDEILAG